MSIINKKLILILIMSTITDRFWFIAEDFRNDYELIKEEFKQFSLPSYLSEKNKIFFEGSRNDFKSFPKSIKHVENVVEDIYDFLIALKNSSYFWKPVRDVTRASMGIYKECEFKILPCAFVLGDTKEDTKKLIKSILDLFLEKSANLKKSPYYLKFLEIQANDYEIFLDEVTPNNKRAREEEEEEEEFIRSVEARFLTEDEFKFYLADLSRDIQMCSEDLELFADTFLVMN
jgi:hypothetical protein